MAGTPSSGTDPPDPATAVTVPSALARNDQMAGEEVGRAGGVDGQAGRGPLLGRGHGADDAAGDLAQVERRAELSAPLGPEQRSVGPDGHLPDLVQIRVPGVRDVPVRIGTAADMRADHAQGVDSPDATVPVVVEVEVAGADGQRCRARQAGEDGRAPVAGEARRPADPGHGGQHAGRREPADPVVGAEEEVAAIVDGEVSVAAGPDGGHDPGRVDAADVAGVRRRRCRCRSGRSGSVRWPGTGRRRARPPSPP